MADLTDFVGTWREAKGFPYSIHTITWMSAGNGLKGIWRIEAAERPAGSAPPDVQGPGHVEMPLVDPRFEDGVLLFRLNGGPFVTEFKLVGPDEAVVGAATNKLPPEFAGPEYQRSIEGHRVRVRRQ